MKKVVLLFCTLTLSFSISVSAQSEDSLPEMQEDCLWITSGQMERGKSMPIFNKAFTVGKKPHKTVLQVTALGIYDVVINGQTVGQHSNIFHCLNVFAPSAHTVRF